MHISGSPVNPFDKGNRRHSYHLSSIFPGLSFLFLSFWYCRLMRCFASNILSMSLFLCLSFALLPFACGHILALAVLFIHDPRSYLCLNVNHNG
ncbi:hypothetical protein BDW42DRAFT_121001 [Aspergillus taichungensis]|uniref:Uncharacterized protein n=1 Tax=Aspergillus taichungensis TaxID=482145 RepID=A0A2J5I7F5_9EURO|nr:hypothetical protein BDW42DRAFT_121001 [Aspergillus taichungensis]